MTIRCSSIVLAGGKSSRIGTDKALLRIPGNTTIIQTVVAKLKTISDDVIVVTRGRRYLDLDVKWASDIYPDAGPLAGIHAGLLAAKYGHALVIACDMPFVNLQLLEYMVKVPRKYDILIPKLKAGVEPLHAIYSRRCLDPIAKRLQNHRLQTLGLLDDVIVHYLQERTIRKLDPYLQSFNNVNTWGNFREAARVGNNPTI
ncbi:MAG: molybdenum cofactor guanylyltransferase [Dehalococcoidales bacterium]|nr:molybdenum cofactor guanylyltransferase [Dehalococcoidales bacterium]